MKRELDLYLEDILKSIAQIHEYTKLISKEEFEESDLIQDGVVLRL